MLFCSALSATSGDDGRNRAHVNAPEFFDRVKGHNFLEQIIPIITLERELIDYLSGQTINTPCHWAAL